MEDALRILNNTIDHIEMADDMERVESLANLVRGFVVGARLLCIISGPQWRAVDSRLESAVRDAKRRISARTVATSPMELVIIAQFPGGR